jgi:hypothetical protein
LSLALDLAKLERTFESAGVEFTNDNRPGARLKGTK